MCKTNIFLFWNVFFNEYRKSYTKNIAEKNSLAEGIQIFSVSINSTTANVNKNTRQSKGYPLYQIVTQRIMFCHMYWFFISLQMNLAMYILFYVLFFKLCDWRTILCILGKYLMRMKFIKILYKVPGIRMHLDKNRKLNLYIMLVLKCNALLIYFLWNRHIFCK